MAVNYTRLGNEFQATNVIGSGQRDPDLTVLTDGRFAAAYIHDLSITDTDVRLQFLNADGTLAGSSLAIDQDSGFQVDPVVVPRLGGGAVVVWHDVNGFHAGSPVTDVIQLRVVSNTGQLSAPLGVSNESASPNRSPDAAMLSDGRVVVVWQTDSSSESDLLYRVLDAAGTGLGAMFFVDSTAHSSFAPAIAASGNKALIAYADGDGRVRVKLFDGATEAVNIAASALGTTVSNIGSVAVPDVSALVDGRYIVVWRNLSNGDIEGRFVDASGTPIGSVLAIAGDPGTNRSPKVAALADGGFIVSWDNDGGAIAPEDGSDQAVLARRFDSTGVAAGDVFLVNTGDPKTDQIGPAIAVNASTGRTLIVWEDYHSFTGTGQDSDPPGIRGRFFLPSTDVVNGTPGNDKMTTYNLGEVINGLAGNDTINARGGNDVVDGGPGSDLVFGETGHDTLGGGEGADTVDGGDGNDLLNGGLGNDSLTGGSGGDRFAFTTALKPKGSNVDTIADFSAPSDSILLDNAIFTKLKKEGPLAAKFFEVGKKAKGKKDFIVYNDKTGDLVYDKNGGKKGGALLFARLEGSPDDLSAADFLVI